MSKALLLDFFIKASQAEEEEARVLEIRAYQEEHAVRSHICARVASHMPVCVALAGRSCAEVP